MWSPTSANNPNHNPNPKYRPISEIHFSFLALQHSMNSFQMDMQNRYAQLLDQQKQWADNLVNTMTTNSNFQTEWMSRLRDFHTRLVPKHDHRAMCIAKKAFEKYLIIMASDTKESVTTSAPITTKEESKKEDSATCTPSTIKTKTKKNLGNPNC